jgi:hypothetical protein
MPTLMLDIPQQTPEHLAMEPSTFTGTMTAIMALQMDELGQLASRQAATLTGVSHEEFL